MRKRFITDITILFILIAVASLFSARSCNQTKTTPTFKSAIAYGLPPHTVDSTTPRPSTRTTTPPISLELPPEGGVQLLEQDGESALLHINMEGHKSLYLELEFNGPSLNWSFNLGDSNTNNGWGGDSMTAVNDAEIQILNGNLDVFGSDLLDHYPEYPPKQRFMKSWKNVVGNNGGLVKVIVADGQVTYIDPSGAKDTYKHPALFALAGQEDAEAGVNYDLYLGINRVVLNSGRGGSGLSAVRLSYLE